MIVVLLGPPGAGKGTQAKIISKSKGFFHFSTGDILRNEIKQGSTIGKKISSIINAGKLVGDDIILDIVDKIVSDEFTKNKGILFDGFPRNLDQANSFEKLGNKINVPISTLQSTISRYNSFVKSGIDEDFDKGKDAYQKNLGDPLNLLNPCLGVLSRPPFYALELFPCDIGASSGLATNSSAQVLKKNKTPIDALYACGNDMKSIMNGKYPGPGVTIGAAMTFGFIAAKHAHKEKILSQT